MRPTPGEPGANRAAEPAPRSHRADAAAAACLVLLAALAALLAVPGPELVPAAGTDAPRWILGVFGDGLAISPGLYLALLYAAIVAWAGFAALGRGLDPGALWTLVATLLALFTLAPPLLSLDAFSYISYARLDVDGLNPYEFGPAALPGDEVAARVDDFRFATSVYGPLFAWLSYPLGLPGAGAALWSLKLAAGLAVGAIALLTARIAVLRGLPAAPAAAFVALNPLVLVHVIGGAHNDGLMVALALVGVLAALSSRPAAAGVALVASAAVKAAGALYAPFALAGGPGRRRLLAGMVAAAALLGLLSLWLFGSEVATALGVAGENQSAVSRWSVPGTLARITGLDVDPIRYALGALYAVALAGLLLWVLRGADWVRAAGWAALGLLLATAWLAPWYLIWVLPPAAVSRDRALISATVALTAFQAINSIPV